MDSQKYRVNFRTLRLMLVISFICTGVYCLFDLLAGIGLPWMADYCAENQEKLPGAWVILIERKLSIPQWYYLLSAVLDVASLGGVVLMWRMRRNGFFSYSLAKVLLMLMPMLFLDRSYVGVGNMMVAVLFIVCYFLLMRSLGILSRGRVNAAEVLPEEDGDAEWKDS